MSTLFLKKIKGEKSEKIKKGIDLSFSFVYTINTHAYFEKNWGNFGVKE